MKGENNHVPVKERFGEEEKGNTGLQQPSVSSQVKFGAAWADKKVFLTQMTPLCLNNHSVPMLEVQVLSAGGDGCCGAVKNSVSAVGSARCPGRTGWEGAEPAWCQDRLGEQLWCSTWMLKKVVQSMVQSWSLPSTQFAQLVPVTGWKRRQWEFEKGPENRPRFQTGAGVWDMP